MKIKKFYKISGLIVGITLGLLSLVLAIPIFFSIFGLGFFATTRAIIPIIAGPLIIFIVITFVCFRIGSKIGGKYEADLQNAERNGKRARIVLFISIIILLLGIAVFLFGISRLFSFYKSVGEEGGKNIEAGIAREKSYEQYATIGDVSFELQEPFSESRGINGKLVEMSLFKKLILVVPISVSQAGTYKVNVDYSDNEVGYALIRNSEQNLNVGINTVKIEFLASESFNNGYSSPQSSKGVARVRLSYLMMRQEFLESLNASERKKVEQFMINYEGSNINPNVPVYKFIGRKEIQF